MEINKIKKIIISRTDKIGDLILSIPSFFMAREMFPNAEITLLVRNYNYDIVKNLPYINKIIKIDDYTEEELENEVKKENSDIFVALYNDKTTSKLTKISGAKIRIGPISKLYSIFVFNKGVFQQRSKSIKNEAYYNLDLIRKINPKLYDEKFVLNNDIYLEEKNRKIANDFYAENKIKEKTLVVNPFMGGSAKNIKDEEYSLLLQKLYDKVKDLNIIIACHITEKERAMKLLEDIKREKVYLFSNEGSLLNLAGIIEKSTVYFGGSTGPTHLAGALKKKIVGLYPNKKTQHPTRWGVINNNMVSYVIPDKNIKEKYSKEDKYFSSFNEEIEKEIIELLEEKLKESR